MKETIDPEEIMPKKTKKADVLDEVRKDISSLKEIVANLVEMALKKDQEKKEEQAVKIPVSIPETPAVTTQSPEFTLADVIPGKWRAKVDEILGSDFGIKVIDSSGGDFIIHIKVPLEWDCRMGDEKWIKKEDIRTGLVRRASPEADVERWCNLIKANIKTIHPNFKI